MYWESCLYIEMLVIRQVRDSKLCIICSVCFMTVLFMFMVKYNLTVKIVRAGGAFSK